MNNTSARDSRNGYRHFIHIKVTEPKLPFRGVAMFLLRSNCAVDSKKDPRLFCRSFLYHIANLFFCQQLLIR